MRAIFLNSWFGTTGKPFFDFIEKEGPKTDIFCFMEVSPDLYSKLTPALKDFDGFYQKGPVLMSLRKPCGQAIFTVKGIKNDEKGKVSIYRQSGQDVGFLLFSKLKSKGKTFWLGNIHGKSIPGNKLDTPVRLKQSEKIIKFFSGKTGPVIFGGDFNLNPDTRSIGMIEKAGYKNLIKDFGIKNTRNRLSWERFENVQHFADFAFVSKDVKVKKFEVPYVEVSDHLPLILDFEV